MNVDLSLKNGMCFSAKTGSGHEVFTDASVDIGGTNAGARPMELLLAGLGGCTGIDVLQMLRKSRQKVDDVRIQISATRSPNIPKVFTHVHVNFTFLGHELSEKHVQRAIDLSAKKYCSASLMLGKTAKIDYHYRIIDNKTCTKD